MKKILMKFKKNRLYFFVIKHQKYAPILFFIAGFIWDSLTLGRIDSFYDTLILSTYMILLTISIYVYNLLDTKRWQTNLIKKYSVYLPLAIQFFLGGLSSAYVIYFSRSVSLSKTATFFVILILLFIANEFLRKRIANKYLQFGFYFFVNFIFLSFFLPVILKEMNTIIFLVSGVLSLTSTLLLITLIYKSSISTQAEIVKWKMLSMILSIYFLINTLYFLKLIPPVPLALDIGLVAYKIEKNGSEYKVTYEIDEWYMFWRDHKANFNKNLDKPVYVFTSVFAPTDLKKKIYHRWKWFDKELNEWQTVDKIGYEIVGGRDNGFRGFTYKNNIKTGEWKVEVITEEELVLGVVDFNININSETENAKVVTRIF